MFHCHLTAGHQASICTGDKSFLDGNFRAVLSDQLCIWSYVILYTLHLTPTPLHPPLQVPLLSLHIKPRDLHNDCTMEGLQPPSLSKWPFAPVHSKSCFLTPVSSIQHFSASASFSVTPIRLKFYTGGRGPADMDQRVASAGWLGDTKPYNYTTID